MADKQNTHSSSNQSSSLDSAVVSIEKVVVDAETKFETAVTPVRTALHRFPTLFLLLVTFGVVATFTGIEQWLLQHSLLREHPLVILSIGILTLIVTGTLYKKLG